MISILEPEMLLINKLYQPLQKMAIDFILEAKTSGLNIEAFSTYRSPEEQDALYFKGRDNNGNVVNRDEIVTNARGLMSWHNYRLALDVVFKSVSGNWIWNAPELDWKKLGEIGKKHGFEWGGDWHFQDLPHFQYTKGIEGLLIARHIYEGEGLDGVLRMIKV